MKIVFERNEPHCFPIKVEQNSAGKFRVTYGKQVIDGLDYCRAASELGRSIFHALTCEGKLDCD